MDIAQETEGSRLEAGPAGERYRSAAGAEAVTVSVYESAVPAFVGRELERLYESLYSTLLRLDIYDNLDQVCTYVEKTGGTISAVLLYQRADGVVRVLNQQIGLASATIARFCDVLFARYIGLRQISFYALRSKVERLPFPFQQFRALDENVLVLPATAQAYFASLSGTFRKNLRVADRRMRQKFPSFRYQVLSGAEVTEATLRDIIRMTGQRMAFKKKSAYIGVDETIRLLPLLRAYGTVGVATVDGRLCGANIWYRVGSHCFMHLIAHDPQYNAQMLGNYLVYLGLGDAIAQGGRECWLMGGGQANKARFGAVPRALASVVVYRSRLHYLVDWRRIAQRALREFLRERKKALAALAYGSSPAARAARTGLSLWRAIQRWHAAGRSQ
jgi:hypothetical protein